MAYLKEHEEHVYQKGYASFGVITIQGPLGHVQLSVCEECPEMRMFCLHNDTAWNESQTILECLLCGVDCT